MDKEYILASIYLQVFKTCFAVALIEKLPKNCSCVEFTEKLQNVFKSSKKSLSPTVQQEDTNFIFDELDICNTVEKVANKKLDNTNRLETITINVASLRRELIKLLEKSSEKDINEERILLLLHPLYEISTHLEKFSMELTSAQSYECSNDRNKYFKNVLFLNKKILECYKLVGTLIANNEFYQKSSRNVTQEVELSIAACTNNHLCLQTQLKCLLTSYGKAHFGHGTHPSEMFLVKSIMTLLFRRLTELVAKNSSEGTEGVIRVFSADNEETIGRTCVLINLTLDCFTNCTELDKDLVNSIQWLEKQLSMLKVGDTSSYSLTNASLQLLQRVHMRLDLLMEKCKFKN